MTHSPDTQPDSGAPLLRQAMVPEHEALNARLRPMLLEMADRIPDKGTNKATGESYFRNKWLSARNLHHLPDPAMVSLVGFIEQAANRITWPNLRPGQYRITAMWAIVSRQGLEGRPHSHSGLISGAYYVDSGDCDEAGGGAFAVYAPDAVRIVGTVRPRTGLMLMFPSTLCHGVQRYDSESPRVVISFNLT
ncbi:putative 2OG-Fe(II) oxygenase [Emcibacter sp. SYSU 3D8]|uniref:putative 2OG-Fe(II) oxygenase n=1 Tax=Emcibacter sp. SYSU 3D8 TaxID=3133969 RepID=UPI0031FF1FFD